MESIVTEQNTEAAVVPAASEQPACAGLMATTLGYVLAPRGDRRGITTIEYVIGIVAGITLVGVLILALSNPSVRAALTGLITHILGMGNSVTPHK